MALTYLPFGLDIHGGGQDLKFPHHENEIAQSEAFSGNIFARFWMHNGFITLDKEKMSKSIGNVFGLRQILKNHTAATLRFFFLSTQYRSPIEFSLECLDEAKAAMGRIANCIDRMDETIKTWKVRTAGQLRDEGAAALDRFEDAMNDDFNTAKAIGVLFELVTTVNSRLGDADQAAGLYFAKDALLLMLDTLGINVKERVKAAPDSAEVGTLLQFLIRLRMEARENGDYTLADRIRDGVEATGFVLEDKANGETGWKRK